MRKYGRWVKAAVEEHHLLHPQKSDIHSWHWRHIPAIGTMTDPIP